ISLTQTQASIQSISQCLGYEGHAAFCRTFHRHFGMSPTRYRRDTPGTESNLQYPLRVGMEIEQERRSAAAAADRDQRMVVGVMTRRAPT
ncbi:helix-turn-helix domain-containing protein, partial [Klebsiella pneumoniae]|uniref:helix-turn-helix domain-containing protein n=1 Tax=Klebsiella pneumoniae TaxID=573 RepID=UPI00272FFB8A